MAPVPFALICFRARPKLKGETEEVQAKRLDALNEAIMHGVNATGKAFLSHTKLHDKLTLRLSIGNIRTTERHERFIDNTLKFCRSLRRATREWQRLFLQNQRD